MTHYHAPLRDIRFALQVQDFAQLSQLPGCEELSPELADAVLEEAARFAENVLTPLNRVGDLQGCRWQQGKVITPDGWTEAYRQFAEAGWVGLELPQEYGGQALPKSLATPVGEMWHAANLAFNMLPTLAVGATESLLRAASPALQACYLPKLVSGEWSAAMDLTEPQAGSDLGALRTRAEPHADGSYRLFGQKIFISYGEHDMAANIVHLVLARLPDAPAGSKGISLFLVPKFLPDAAGEPGARNDIQCVSIEHKLGLHGSPTCTLVYGEQGGATGYLIGQPNRGLEAMFVMMNEARLSVALQGVGLGERAYQHAVAYARERVQGRAPGAPAAGAIIQHPDVKRMLLGMRARLLATRLLIYHLASLLDRAHRQPDAAAATAAQQQAELLVPVAKGWGTETGVELSNLAVQVFGGSGFIEETGIAQQLRDARVTTIYEGTTGIQAADLVGRKLVRDQGAALQALQQQMLATASALLAQPALAALGQRLAAAANVLQQAGAQMLQQEPASALAVAVPFLQLCGGIAGAWQLGKAALLAAQQLDSAHDDYQAGIIALARFYYSHQLPQAEAWLHSLQDGGAAVCDYPLAAL
ncbi:acyl-CoA dehydrogenase [Vogesella oryzae]|uniref:acyl-CoA dehydrogenase n=1 Tax=Vogesella oryzae TaxID=1735285 RepID=UPI001583AE1A|nr:acyl-CoA dehydrogenase [Vogesella oryzae]